MVQMSLPSHRKWFDYERDFLLKDLPSHALFVRVRALRGGCYYEYKYINETNKSSK